MLFRRKSVPAPQVDRVGKFCTVVGEALSDATTEKEWDRSLKARLAEALENFAREVRFDLASR